MKKINNIILIFGALLFILSSCDKDNIAAVYSPNAEQSGASFMWTQHDVVVFPTDNSFSVPVNRDQKSGELTVSVSSEVSTKDADGKKIILDDLFSVPSTLVYSEGEIQKEFPITLVGTMDFGKIYTVSLEIIGRKSVGSIPKLTLSVSKEYDWKSFGTGKFVDTWALDDTEFDVEILKAEGFDRYRVVKPYEKGVKSGLMAKSFGSWLTNEQAEYIEFWRTKPGEDLVMFKTFALGANYQGKIGQAIIAKHPSSLKGEDITFNKFIDTKTVQLAPYFYVDALKGGWNMTEKNNIITIKLP